MDLRQLVQQELAENPALEEVETYEEACARCGLLIADGICRTCASADMASDTSPTHREEAPDPLLFVAAPRSLTETILIDLYATLPTADHPIALALVGSLDDRGFLTCAPAVIAVQYGVPLVRVDHRL